MQTQLDTFNKLEELSNTLFCGFEQIGGRDNNDNNEAVSQTESEITSPNSPGGELLDSAKTIFKGSVKAIDSFIPHSIIDDYLGPGVGDEAWDNVAPNLINNIEQSGRLVSHAVKDPKVRKALEKAVVVYGQALNEVYGIAEPVVDDLVTKFWITINNMGEKSARGATNAMIDTVSAAVAEIPMVGGLVDLFIAGGKWFNAIASGILAPTITAYGDVAGKAIYTGREGLAIGNKYGSELSGATSDLRSALSQAMPPRPPNGPPPRGPPGRPPMTPPNSRNNSSSSLVDQGRAAVSAAMAHGTNMLNQAKKSDHGKAAMATGDYAMQLGKTGLRSAKLGESIAKGNYFAAAKHGMGLGLDSAKLGYKGVKAARAVNRAQSNKSRGGGHQPFMFGGSKKSSKRARKTSKRLLKSINRFTRKSR